MWVIEVLFLLLPGLIARLVVQCLNLFDDKQVMDYAWIFKALLYNIPALSLSWLLIWLGGVVFKYSVQGMDSLSGLIARFDSLPFVLAYIAVASVAGLVVGFIITWQQKDYSISAKLINWLRKKLGKAERSAFSVWQKTFDNQDEPVIEIVCGDKGSYKGLLRHFSDGGSEKTITIDGIEELKEWQKYLQKIKSVYYDTQSNTLIKIYDTEEFHQAINRSKA